LAREGWSWDAETLRISASAHQRISASAHQRISASAHQRISASAHQRISASAHQRKANLKAGQDAIARLQANNLPVDNANSTSAKFVDGVLNPQARATIFARLRDFEDGDQSAMMLPD
jgi:hypothetical protein